MTWRFDTDYTPDYVGIGAEDTVVKKKKKARGDKQNREGNASKIIRTKNGNYVYSDVLAQTEIERSAISQEDAEAKREHLSKQAQELYELVREKENHEKETLERVIAELKNSEDARKGESTADPAGEGGIFEVDKRRKRETKEEAARSLWDEVCNELGITEEKQKTKTANKAVEAIENSLLHEVKKQNLEEGNTAGEDVYEQLIGELKSRKERTKEDSSEPELNYWWIPKEEPEEKEELPEEETGEEQAEESEIFENTEPLFEEQKAEEPEELPLSLQVLKERERMAKAGEPPLDTEEIVKTTMAIKIEEQAPRARAVRECAQTVEHSMQTAPGTKAQRAAVEAPARSFWQKKDPVEIPEAPADPVESIGFADPQMLSAKKELHDLLKGEERREEPVVSKEPVRDERVREARKRPKKEVSAALPVQKKEAAAQKTQPRKMSVREETEDPEAPEEIPTLYTKQYDGARKNSPWVLTVKEIGGSGWMFLTAMSFTLSVGCAAVLYYLETVLGISSAQIILSIIGIGSKWEKMIPLVATQPQRIALVSTTIPMFLIAIGLWWIYISCRSAKTIPGMTGFALTGVILRILTYVTFVIGGIMSVISGIDIWKVSGVSGDVAVQLAVGTLSIVIVAWIFFQLIIRSIHKITVVSRSVLRQGYAGVNAPFFAPFALFFLSGISVYQLLVGFFTMSGRGLILFVGKELFAAIAYFCAGVSAWKLRSRFSRIRKIIRKKEKKQKNR